MYYPQRAFPVDKRKKSYKRSIAKIAGISYILFIVFFGLWGVLSQYQKKDARYKDYDLFVGLMSNVPEADNDYFVAYNVDPSVYHIGNILPCYKYSGCQDWLMGMNKEQYERVYDEFNTLKARWILVNYGFKAEKVKINCQLKRAGRYKAGLDANSEAYTEIREETKRRYRKIIEKYKDLPPDTKIKLW